MIQFHILLLEQIYNAHLVEMVDTTVSKTVDLGHMGSSPIVSSKVPVAHR
jgi:hypothetical protein